MTSDMCSSHFRSFVIFTPSILTNSVDCNTSPASLSGSSTRGSVLNETSINMRFFGFKDILLVLAHWSKQFRSSWMVDDLFVNVFSTIVRSSTYLRVILLATEVRAASLTCATKVAGPVSVPWGTPPESFSQGDRQFWYLTHLDRWCRKLHIQGIIDGLVPIWMSLGMATLWFTRSNALLKSVIMTLEILLLFSAWDRRLSNSLTR